MPDNSVNKRYECVLITEWQNSIPYDKLATYLRMNFNFDTKLRWKEHAKTEGEKLDIKYKKICWLIEMESQLYCTTKFYFINETSNLSGIMRSNSGVLVKRSHLLSRQLIKHCTSKLQFSRQLHLQKCFFRRLSKVYCKYTNK